MQVSGDVAVVGAGLIGLATAFELAQRGAVVRVYDREEPARAASWAGAGMLSPHAEPIDESLLQLCEESLAAYPAFVARVRDASGIDPHLHLNGHVHAAFDDRSLEQMRERADALRARGVACDVVDRKQLLAMEPWLGSHATGGLAIAGEGQVDNRLLGRALTEACAARGVSVTRVTSLRVECDKRRVLGLRSNLGFTPAVAVVNACGAWAASLDGVPDEARPAVEPFKGQMLALQAPVDLVRRSTWLPGAYVVPRDDGRLLIGATVEPAKADARVTSEGLHRLLHAALEAAPALGGFAVTETWAGVRPGSADGLPFIGATPIEGLYVATGHFRNGILLCVVSARLVADAVAGIADPKLAAFSLHRRMKAS
ncbi:MAG TPA: glycine oxidase ThiO [Candidatus Baltobacteraceae bacterium]|jgi:glycine oxidase|nr:glycine oxidase ThiO [Candidatus Baltobacteraceae bacterium]